MKSMLARYGTAMGVALVVQFSADIALYLIGHPSDFLAGWWSAAAFFAVLHRYELHDLRSSTSHAQ